MAQLNVKLSDRQLEGLRRFGARRRIPLSWLIRDYIDFLLAGGRPVGPSRDIRPPDEDLGELGQHGGGFDWLADEPDLYSIEDGEPA